jgi:hypothetical protein
MTSQAMVPVVAPHGVSDLEKMARAFAASKLFGVQNTEQALALCLVAQAEGRHPASAAQDYNIIQGRPAKKTDAMLRDFISGGGKVEWHSLTDDLAEATFSHPQGGSVRISWDHRRAQAAGINNPMWKKYPRQMLRSRTVSEGVRTVFPMATSGMYVPEEVQDFDEPKVVSVRDVTPKAEPQRPALAEAPEPPAATNPTNPIDRSGEAVPVPDGDFPPDWEAWRKIVVAKINKARSEEEVAAIQAANAAGLAECAKVLTDTVERMNKLVDAKLGKLSEREAA